MDQVTFNTHALMNITQRPSNVFVLGEGAWLYDHQGNRFLDFIQGWAVNCLGHAPRAVADAISLQARTLLTPSPAFFNDKSVLLARRLTELSGLDQVFFTNSGAEANEGAIKLARKYGARHCGGAHEIITFHDAFHGRTLATMSASGKAAFAPLFEPKVPGFPKARLNDLDSVIALINDKTVAVMLEPILGEAGVIPADDDFIRALRRITADRGLLLILDEIQTGAGRTGKMFHYQNTGITPDILTLGKGLGGGVPLAAMLASPEASCFEYGDQGGTFNGNPLMCAAGLAVLEELTAPGFLDDVLKASQFMTSELTALSGRHGLGAVRGRGLLLALELGAPVSADIATRAFGQGLLVNAPRVDCLRFMPALNVSHAEISAMITILDRVFAG